MGRSSNVWWRCAKGHEWEASPNNRSKGGLRTKKSGSGCPFCAGKRAIVGETDLLTNRPDIASQWHPDNSDGPESFTTFSSHKVRWLCEFGHDWESTIYNRTKGGNGCPHCARRSASQIEINVLCSLSRYTEVRSRVAIDGMQVDIHLPQLGYIVEYDGYFWHHTRHVEDGDKSQRVLDLGYKLHRFREKGLENLGLTHPAYSESEFTWSRLPEEIDRQVDSWISTTVSMRPRR